MDLRSIDYLVIVVYLLAILLVGVFSARKSRTTDEFMAAGRSLPGWVVGLSIFGTFLSSITFLGVPGKAFQSNWNPWVFSLSLPIAGLIAMKVFVPFYRKATALSAYEHLEHRFGSWARGYVSLLYLSMQVARCGMILSGVALPVSQMTGFSIESIIIVSGTLITFYTVLGGIEAVIWTDVVQSVVLGVGALVALIAILMQVPGGPAGAIEIAQASDKMSLGSWSLDFAQSTIWVMLIYGLVINLTNFGIDQSYVQRYLTAKTDRAAVQSVWVGILLYIPTSLIFFVIGTSLWALDRSDPKVFEGLRETIIAAAPANVDSITDPVTRSTADVTDAELGDRVFPYFLVNHLPVGISGLLIAAIIAAAMSSVDTSLNSSATVILVDFYRRYLSKQASEQAQMRVLYGATLAMGVAGTCIGLYAAKHKSLLDVWWDWSGLLAGGMLGLFLLGMLAERASSPVAIIATILGTLVILWISPPKAESLPEFLKPLFDSTLVTALQPWINKSLAGACGTLTIFLVGYLLSFVWPSRKTSSASTSEASEHSTEVS